MLDAGCGTGLNLASLPDGSTGIDLNPRNLELVRKRLPRHNAVLGDVEAMPFEDEAFGSVVCTEVLEPFHNEYRVPEVQEMLSPFEIDRIWYSAMRFNILFVARRPGAAPVG